MLKMLFLTCCIFSLPVLAFGPPGPMPKGPMPGPVSNPLQGLALGQIKDRVCLNRTANRMKSCVSTCPQATSNNQGPECMVQCVSQFASTIQKCL